MLTHRGFSAWIVVDGNPLQEHLVAVNDSAHSVSCWVPSEEGKTFSVYWKDHGGGVETCAYIMLDGYLAPGRFLYGEGITWRRGVRTGPTSERPFMFQRVDEQGLEDSGSIGKDVGTIVLRIKRVKFASVAPSNHIQGYPSTHKGRSGVRIGLGAEQPCFEQYPSTWKVEPYDNPGQRKPSTYVSFIFRYRSPDFLRAQGIIDDMKISAVPLMSSQRRVVSMPTSIPLVTPSPSPPTITKKPLIDPNYYHLVSVSSGQPVSRPTYPPGFSTSEASNRRYQEGSQPKDASRNRRETCQLSGGRLNNIPCSQTGNESIAREQSIGSHNRGYNVRRTNHVTSVDFCT